MDERAHSSENRQFYIGVDFDGTLAKALDQYREGEVGSPIWNMIFRVQRWLKEGKKVKIITARGGNPTDEAAIHYFLNQVGLPPLQVTNVKDKDMIAMWDDKAVTVCRDSGIPITPAIPPEAFSATLRLFSAEPATLFDGEAHASVIIIFSGTKVALVARDEDKKDMLPAGHVDVGETAVQCASRELREETGLDVAPEQLIFVGATIRESKQQNNSFFTGQVEGSPKLKAGSDVDQAFWQDVWNLPSLKFDPIGALLKARKVLATDPEDRGLLIAFEGVDGSGKSTQVRLLSEFLSKRGIAFTVSKWNSSELISNLIGELKTARKLSPSLFFLLHAADMMARYEGEIIPALKRNEVVLCDRYFYTGIVRDAVRGIDPKQNKGLYDKLRRPDVLFYCGISPRDAVGRLDKDRLGHYNTGMDVGGFGEGKKESAVGYEEEMDRLYQVHLPEQSITLDAASKPTTIAKAVLDHIQDLILERYEIGDEETESADNNQLLIAT
jgi:dTMP kinase